MAEAETATSTRVMDWALLAPFDNPQDPPWLARYLDGSRDRMRAIPREHQRSSWHNLKKATTGLAEWRHHHRRTRQAWRTKPDGIVTVFPQLAFTTGLRKRLSGSKIPVVAWCLNIGRDYRGLKGSLARFALSSLDCYVVHSRREFGVLDLPPERFEFVPLQRGYMEPTIAEQEDRPFLLAMGSARRDYPTLLEALRPLRIPTVLVASPRIIEELDVPDFVEVRSGLSRDQCLELVQKSRLNVVPIDNDETASGQITVVEAMWMARPLIATDTIGTEDYITSGVDGVLVPPKDVESLRHHILQLWEDRDLRDRLGKAARERAMAQFSDENAGAALSRILGRFHR